MIVDRFHDRRCVPFLGAGANIDRKSPPYQGLPMGGELARLFATKLKYSKRRAAELARIALEFEVRSDAGVPAHRGGRRDLVLAATVLALVMVNGPFGAALVRVVAQELTRGAGGLAVTQDPEHWVNDGLMVISSSWPGWRSSGSRLSASCATRAGAACRC